MNETASPLFWPRKQPRTPATKREAPAPFSVGETKTEKKTERRWNGTTYDNVETERRKISSKRVTIASATDRLEKQLERLGATVVVLSTNLELRLNGMPRANQSNPADPGAAVWFNLKGKRMVFACDKWQQVADNIAALAAHIRAIRSVENFGVGTLEQAFAGYRALPDPTMPMNWRDVLGHEVRSRDEAERIFRERAKRVHPDVGGSPAQFAQLNAAIQAARQELQ